MKKTKISTLMGWIGFVCGIQLLDISLQFFTHHILWFHLASSLVLMVLFVYAAVNTNITSFMVGVVIYAGVTLFYLTDQSFISNALTLTFLLTSSTTLMISWIIYRHLVTSTTPHH